MTKPTFEAEVTLFNIEEMSGISRKTGEPWTMTKATALISGTVCVINIQRNTKIPDHLKDPENLAAGQRVTVLLALTAGQYLSPILEIQDFIY